MSKQKDKKPLVLPIEYQPDAAKNRRYQQEHEQIVRKVHDQEHNEIFRFFQRFYKGAALICCLILIFILLVEVSYLPPVGSAQNPVNNEVAAKYIEDGLQDTGAVNIVTGIFFLFMCQNIGTLSHLKFKYNIKFFLCHVIVPPLFCDSYRSRYLFLDLTGSGICI